MIQNKSIHEKLGGNLWKIMTSRNIHLVNVERKKNNSYEFLLKRYYKRSSWILNREMFLLNFFFLIKAIF